MRLDRLITLHVALPLLSLFSSGKKILPILMYHSISDETESSRSAYFKVCTAPGRFSEQMRWMSDHGYRGVSLEDGLAWLNSPMSATDFRPVAITFDDGFRDFYTTAFPILRELRFCATMYLPTKYIGDTSREFLSRKCLAWGEIRELTEAGIEFGSHTVTHRKMIELDWPDIEVELRVSKEEIESRLGKRVASFAYPYAFPHARRDFCHRFQELVGSIGYESNVTTGIGRASGQCDPFDLRRLPVNGDDDLPFLRAKLEGAYDWLAIAQAGRKTLRHVFTRSAAASVNGSAKC